MSSLLFNMVLQYSLKDEIQRWQKKKGMGIYLSDQERDCLTNLRFADDVMLFATSKEQLRNMMYEFKKATEKVGLKIHPDKTKILSNQSTMNSNTKRCIKVGEMSIEILTKKRKREIFGPENLVPPTRDIGNQEQDQSSMGDLPQIQTRTDIKKYMFNHRLRLFDATVSPTLCYAAGTWTPSKEHERMIQSTERKMLRLIIQTKRKDKKIEKQDIEPKDEKGIADKTENCSTDEESGDGQSTKSEDDVDSGVTFDEDSEKEIDTIEFEEEDWIEYIKRSTVDALDKMERAKVRCWNRTQKKRNGNWH